jgi:hypothetical protein
MRCTVRCSFRARRGGVVSLEEMPVHAERDMGVPVAQTSTDQDNVEASGDQR